MSPRAIVFVEQWIDERVQPGVYHDEEGPDARTAHLVEQLMLDADSAGIPQEEIEQEYPDLFGDVARAMGNAPDPAQVVDDKTGAEGRDLPVKPTD